MATKDYRQIIKVRHIYTVNDPHFVDHFKQHDVFDGASMATALEHCGRGIVIDGGAHVGSWTMYLSNIFDEVYSFEPNPYNFECLRLNTENLENVKIFNVALGKEEGEGAYNWGGNSGAGYITEGDGVKIITIDSLDLPGLDLLKLDIEGFEPQALMGAEKTIKKYRPTVLVERNGASDRYKTGDAEDVLKELGYRFIVKSHNDYIYKYRDI